MTRTSLGGHNCESTVRSSAVPVAFLLASASFFLPELIALRGVSRHSPPPLLICTPLFLALALAVVGFSLSSV